MSNAEQPRRIEPRPEDIFPAGTTPPELGDGPEELKEAKKPKRTRKEDPTLKQFKADLEEMGRMSHRHMMEFLEALHQSNLEKTRGHPDSG